MIKIKVQGIEQELKRIKSQLADVGETQSAIVSKQLVSELKEATPVDTGEARDGWVVKPTLNKGVYTIENDVEHVKYLNAGSSQQAPAHFIEQTILSNKKVSPDGEIVTYR